eukprot:5749272-Amphidinium_carterae.3
MLIYLLRVLDGIERTTPDITILNTVDDIFLHCRGTVEVGIIRRRDACQQLTLGLQSLRLPLNHGKTMLLWADRGQRKPVTDLATDFGFQSKLLGCTLNSGRRRNTRLQQRRLGAGAFRLCRIRKHRRLMRGRAAVYVQTSARPVASFGLECTGLADSKATRS